jgi:hypothetical protein
MHNKSMTRGGSAEGTERVGTILTESGRLLKNSSTLTNTSQNSNSSIPTPVPMTNEREVKQLILKMKTDSIP